MSQMLNQDHPQSMGGISGMSGMSGGFMFQYRFMYMAMDGNRDGTRNLTPRGVTDQGFMMASPEMRMKMHMLMGMRPLSPQLTAMVMANYLDKEMEMVNAMGVTQPSMVASGWGDIDGRDTRIDPRMSPYGDPDRQGGRATRPPVRRFLGARSRP